MALDRIEEGDALSVILDTDEDGFDDEKEEGTETGGGDERLSSSADAAPKLGQKETLYVNYSKVLVVVVILVMASAIGWITYTYVSNQEDNAFQKQVRIRM